MARKRSATVEYLKGKTWSILVRSSDPVLRAKLMGAIWESEERGLTILNAADPFASADAKPRRAKAKKPQAAWVDAPELAEAGR